MSETLTLDSILPPLEGKTFAYIGDITFTRDFLIKQFIIDGLNKGTTCIIALTQSANEIISSLSNFSEGSTTLVNDAIMNEQLQIIDAYSFRSGKIDEQIPGTTFLNSPDDLTDISITINKVGMEFPQTRYVIWPLSLLTLYNNLPNILNFLQTLAARVSTREQTVMGIIDRDVLGTSTLVAIESILDGVLESRRSEENNETRELFRIKFFKGAENSIFNTWKQIS